jgi:hypothetical protein
MNWLAGCAFPHNHGFALIRNSYRRHIARPRAYFAQRFDGTAHLAGQDLGGVVFDPTWLRIKLFELVLSDGGYRARLGKQNGS